MISGNITYVIIISDINHDLNITQGNMTLVMTGNITSDINPDLDMNTAPTQCNRIIMLSSIWVLNIENIWKTDHYNMCV